MPIDTPSENDVRALSQEQRDRYERNLLIPRFGEEGQLRLLRARVLIVGLGGLGSPAAYYLAAAGVGTLGLADFDAVALSNLQRQIMHRTEDIGVAKTESAARALNALNPGVRAEVLQRRLDTANAKSIIARYDAVVEACDNFPAKFLINDVCLELEKPFATAGILALAGQAQFVVPGRTACLRCAVPEIPASVPTTAQLGVLGALPGILGSVEALEIIRWLTGFWSPQPDGAALVHTVDGETMRLRTMRLPRRPGCRCATQAQQQG